MIAAEIINSASAGGLQLSVSPAGKIIASGDEEAVSRWLPLIRENKEGILALLYLIKSPQHQEIALLTETSKSAPTNKISLDFGWQVKSATHQPNQVVSGTPAYFKKSIRPEAMGCFKIGFPWLRDNLADLLRAGWTRRELFGRGRYKWPIGNWGTAWLPFWGDPSRVVSIGISGQLIFSFITHSGQAQQTAWPNVRNSTCMKVR